jgi:hypothetical protein
VRRYAETALLSSVHSTGQAGGLVGADTARLKVCRKIVQSAYWTLVPCPERRSGSNLYKLFQSTDLSQFFAELKSRNIRRLAVAYVTAGLLLIELAAILLAIFEATAWGVKLLVGAVAVGKGHVPVRRLLVRKT